MSGRSICLASLRLGTLLASLAFSQPSGAEEPIVAPTGSALPAAPPSSASSSSAPSEPPSHSPDPRTTALRAFLAGTLDTNVDPESLFDERLDDEAAVQVQITHLRAVVGAARAARDGQRLEVREETPGDSAAEGSADDAFAALDPATAARRMELDEARLEFYELPIERRAELRRLDAERKAAAVPKETEEERHEREAAAERERALEAARVARSEGERVVSEELARLIDIESEVDKLRREFQKSREDFSVLKNTVLGWQRRGREARSAGPAEADSMYDALGRAFDSALSDFSSAIDATDDDVTRVPALWNDPLGDVPFDIPTDAARERRSALQTTLAGLRADEVELARERAAALRDEVNALNRTRLELLAHLSPEKRAAIVGFTSTGLEHARSEAQLVELTLAHHRKLARSWITSARSGSRRGSAAWRTALFLLPMFAFALAFTWARRRSKNLLAWTEARLVEEDRAERRTGASFGLRLVRFVAKLRRTLELLLLAVGVHWLLPRGAKDLFEVQLVSSVVGWSLVGALVVETLDALSSGDVKSSNPAAEDVAPLRLRSLRLVGRTVIVFSLGLVLSARLVGQGTIYAWMSTLFWFATVPVFLVLVRWWRRPVFERLERLRKKTRLQTWILENKRGWKSFGAATVGAVQLFVTGAQKLLRSWLSGFDVARRAHAYLFKREIERLGDTHKHGALVEITDDLYEGFDPELPAPRWLACSADELRDALISISGEHRMGLVAIVGARGMGKTSLLKSVAERVPGAQVVSCTRELSSETLTSALNPESKLVLLDDAHVLIEPRIGGLARFDEVVAVARSQANERTWVFALDAVLWPLLRRARDAQPIFEETHLLEPWDEGQIGALIADRAATCNAEPKYDALLDRLAPGSDEQDRIEALEEKRTGYQRMLWDHVGGNPGLALEAWRNSLACDEAGDLHVRRLQLPDTTKLEGLPDASLFVLRAVLQLAPTTAEAVAQAVRLQPERVVQELRAGTARGLYEERPNGIRVAWPWLRAVRHLLERRHLLGGPS